MLVCFFFGGEGGGGGGCLGFRVEGFMGGVCAFESQAARLLGMMVPETVRLHEANTRKSNPEL